MSITPSTTTETTGPTAHLSDADVEALGAELDTIRAEVMADLGEDDARYIHRVIAVQRGLEAGGRGLLQFSLLPPAWVAGTAALSVSKVLENMEIGHNVLHGQWDWMNDPEIHSTSWEWDSASSAEGWKYSHNDVHHTYTNVLGKDSDLGYAAFRTSATPRSGSTPTSPGSPGTCSSPSTTSGWPPDSSTASRSTTSSSRRSPPAASPGPRPRPSSAACGAKSAARSSRTTSGSRCWPDSPPPPPCWATSPRTSPQRLVARGDLCGHFPAGAETFTEEQLDGETRAQWYLRQMLGSANLDGSPLFHLMTGNLSHQIEHHLFPDMPSNRYAQVAPKVRALCEQYGLAYTSGSLPRQYGNVLRTIARLALPGGGNPSDPDTHRSPPRPPATAPRSP